MLDRRAFLLTTTAATAAAAGFPAWAQPAATPLNSLFDIFFQENLRHRPEGATQLGLDKGPNADLRARLSDDSAAGRASTRALTQSQLKRLKAVDAAHLSETDRVNYDTVLYTLHSQAAVQGFDFGGAGYGPSPYVVSQQTGAYQSTPEFLDTKHKVETKADADAYLSRLAAYSTQLDNDTDRMKHDAGVGVLPPDFILDRALEQMTKQRVSAREAKVVASITRRAAAKGLGDSYAADAAKIYNERILPALDRQIAETRALRAKAGHDAGVWHIPQGVAFYNVALHNTTTTSLSPAEVHQFGVDQAKAISARMDALLKSQGMTQGSVGARVEALYKVPGQLYPNTDAGKADAIAYCNGRLAAIRGRLPKVFRRMPPYQFEVRRVPPELEAGAASAFSQSPAIDGSRPGLVYFNLHDSAEWPKFMLATVVYHEGLPGHQFEGGLALSNKSLPMIRKTGGFSGYGEGWALYAEQVADELGMYDDDPLGRIGYLKEQLFRAQRCIVDTGLHHLRWSKERAIQQFVDEMGETPGFATREVERYSVNPGQACSYKLGHSVFTGIRGKAQKTLGDRYNIMDFHDAVLGCGRVPLDVLQQVGDRWIASYKA